MSFISHSTAFYWDLSWCLSFRTVLHFTETCHCVFHFALYRILLRPVTVLQTNLSLLFVLSQLLCSKLNLFCIYLRMLIFENAYIWECLYLRMHIFENAYIWECLYLRMLIFENAYIWECLYLRMLLFEREKMDSRLIHVVDLQVIFRLVKLEPGLY